MSIGKKIKELRQRRGWSQDDLAERLGMTRANISNYERDINKALPSDILMRIADIMNVSADYLLGKSDDPETPESKFLKTLELSDEEILKKFSLELDGKELTKEEARIAVAVLRTNRQMKG
ncbi:helix-turn-helix domain-containing protein [Chengkuizengella axinellae]|uniref:Helix-turn-helix transcriptional regulator n=1 Tax=Chengkuizengella axinellae TaxID=3064388 RepID=A0ABT9J0X9_9BACL|nr:helix-turn-helix transcriptional regulator [Chengkuizengella sp. 2205SS18-9]MDP5275072.1 helix-turn-helix transcriptional regulator [Chengkuizengella sp. 2205SS18-9]